MPVTPDERYKGKELINVMVINTGYNIDDIKSFYKKVKSIISADFSAVKTKTLKSLLYSHALC